MKRKSERRLAFAGRIAAIPFGYILTSIIAGCLARVLPASRIEATVTAMLLSFALYAILLMWAFAAHNVLRLWLWIGGLTIVFGSFLTYSIMTGGRA
jgi:hypothetical protein